MTTAHAHDHEHQPFLKHHWDTPVQQFEAGKLGMWLFLATEVLLFGGLFCGYAVWRGNHPEMFKYGSQFLNTTLGATNTAVLIMSSLTMATAVTMAQKGMRRGLIFMLVLTLAGAVTFLVIKYFEYSHKFHEGWYPGIRLYEEPHHGKHEPLVELPPAELKPQPAADVTQQPPPAVAAAFALPPGAEPTTVPPPVAAPEGIKEAQLEEHLGFRHKAHEAEAELPDIRHDPNRPDNAHMFFNLYFLMTGLHGVHVAVGGIMLCWLLIGSIKGRFNQQYFTPVDLGGLYWHVVDLIWIFLFPLFYLI